MKAKKILAAFLSLLLLVALTACGNGEQPETVQTLPTIETAPQKEYTTDEAVTMFNAAVNKIEQAQSYTMTGSVNSTAVMGETLTSVVTSIDCGYQIVDGEPVMLMDSVMNNGGTATPHLTYFADGKYYFNAYGLKYFTESNDYTDFVADDYLEKIDKQYVSDLNVTDNLDGSKTLEFNYPYGQYNSAALSGWLGGFVSETVGGDMVFLKVELDADNSISSFYMTFTTSIDFSDSTIEQIIVLNLMLSDYNATTVTAPADLDTYEDWTVDENATTDETEGVGMLPPEDVD